MRSTIGSAQRARPRVAARLAPIPAALLLVLVAVLAVVAYYPFDWDPPRMVRNQVTRGTDGTLRFGGDERGQLGGNAVVAE
jgi:hypothetical protein